MTFSHDLSKVEESYNVILSFLGVGCILRNDMEEISEYVRSLDRFLENGGTLVSIEIEKTDNIFARFFFERVFGLGVPSGLDREELNSIMERLGFKDIQVVSKEGLLFAFCTK